jgi:AraC-like DNA-binding protein
MTVRSSGQSFIRSRELIAESKDQFLLSVTRTGAVVAKQRRREVEVGAGSATLISYDDPLTLHRPAAGMSRNVLVPRTALAAMVDNIDDVVLRPLSGGAEGLRLLIGYLDMLHDDGLVASPEACRLAVAHIHDLVAVGAAGPHGRGMRAARLQAIKADISRHLDRSDLTVDSLAGRHRLHPRYIQRLFEGAGTTFSQFLTDQRLRRAQRMLVEADGVDRNIGAIAFACGFGDLSYFNRCFRRRFGMTPSQMRAEAFFHKTD